MAERAETKGADTEVDSPPPQSEGSTEDRSSRDRLLVLFVDNRDSFVWNLVDAFSVAGAETVVRPNTVILKEVREIDPDAVVISPGPGSPENPRDIGNCVEIIREVDVPIFGVCLGLQAAAVAFGGSVGHAPSGPVHGKASDVKVSNGDTLEHPGKVGCGPHDPDVLFEDVEGPLRGGRYHSLVVADPGELEVTARNGDGEGVIMAARHPNRPVYGVQFHPESILTPDGGLIVENFLKEVKA
ncbi:MAG: Anthranilate synthase component 2 [Methanonatronarchaeales archaeon]|nr:Anthranilate synthase component 2 [Methanonatronarchaeales archaeon]